MNPVTLRLLPDGSGRVRIHFFVRDQKGPVRTAGGLMMAQQGPVQIPLRVDGTVGFIACQPRVTNIQPIQRGTDTLLDLANHTDDPRAATCPECCATQAYRDHMALLAGVPDLSGEANVGGGI